MSRGSAAERRMDEVRQRLDHLVHHSPRAAIEEAKRLLRDAPDDPTTNLVAWTAIGRALYELGDLDRAIGAVRRAIARGSDADPDQLTSARISAAVVYAEAGQLGAAERELDLAEAAASGPLLGRVLTQRAFVLTHAGALDAALIAADRAVDELTVRSDPLGRLRLLVHRSVIQLQRSDFAAARAELHAARGLAERLDQDVITATIVGNLGVAHSREGRLATALEHFDEAEARYVAAGRPLRMMAVLETDRAEALRSAGRHDEAVRAARRAVDHGAASGNLVVHADTELALAHAWWAAGDLARGRAAAARSGALMMRARRRAMALQTRALVLEMTLADSGGHIDRPALARSRRLAARLDRSGWHDAARQLRSARLRHAWTAGQLIEVDDDLERLASLRRSGRPPAAAAGWYAESLRRWSAGDRAAAGRAALRGLERASRPAPTPGPSEIAGPMSLDAEAPASVRDLERVLVASVVRDGRPQIVVGRVERMRAVTDGRPTPERFSLATVRRSLGTRGVVHYLVDGDDVWASVLHGRTTTTSRVASAAEVRSIVGPLASWLDRGSTAAAVGADVPSSAPARALAARLEALLLPESLNDVDGLVIVPDDLLVDVPWSGLPRAGRRPLVVSRSLAEWRDAVNRSVSPPARMMLVVGPEIDAGGRDRHHVERCYEAPVVVEGRHATVEAARSALRRPGVVQLSAHGHLARRPSMSSLRLADGEGTLDDLAPGTITADLVILASCETAGATIRRGAHLHGFASELVRRGAGAVVAPTARVSDEACAEFVGAFHARLARGVSVGRALAEARIAADPDPSLPEWAAAASFVCVGDDEITLQTAHIG